MSHPLPHFLALNKFALAMCQQLAEAGSANMGELAVQWPAGQAKLAQMVKSSLAMSEEWKTMQAAAFNQLLHCQLALFKPQQTASIQDLMELHDSLSHDLAAQRRAALKEACERLDTCMADLRQAQSSEDIALVTHGLFEDIGKKLRANAEQTATLLTSATAAASVLTGTALDRLATSVQGQ
ncbi:hypothetical protein SAMN05518865_12915 [Duganella sp. CF458]|uniref:hypothetical protein n=1 Tax=Duganella sp. CF458 TaxID=1884368 RepID=UPI0008E519A1|nr:hypothetical protein [Duganella sp. CF458]SFH00682.1 hypothetical protein SAMN05518865_12915 [Duganella sp. CF458]